MQRGSQHTPETKAKMAEARRRLWADPEYKARLRKTLKGIPKPPITDEHRAKLVAAQARIHAETRAAKEQRRLEREEAAQKIGYIAAHHRLRRQRGSATDQSCIDCGEQATDWSYEGGAPDERVVDDNGPFSLDPSYYVPRCRSCHTKFDAA